MRRQEHNPGRLAEWVKKQLASHHSNVVACALANKLARIAWAVTAHQTEFIKQEVYLKWLLYQLIRKLLSGFAKTDY